MELRNRVAIVTGGAVRLGRAICEALADAGMHVCLHYGSSRRAAEETAAALRTTGGEVATVQADLRNPAEAAEKIVSAAVAAFGRIDVLVNNAAIFERGLLQDTTPEALTRHQRINLEAPLFLCQQFAARLAQDEAGAILNIVDWRALRPQPGHLAYTLSKAGLVCLTQLLAQELAPRIRVNAIAPGAILPTAGADREDFHRLSAVIPLRRTGAPDDVVTAAMFLLQSEFVTGEVLHVTGGQQLAAPNMS